MGKKEGSTVSCTPCALSGEESPELVCKLAELSGEDTSGDSSYEVFPVHKSLLSGPKVFSPRYNLLTIGEVK